MADLVFYLSVHDVFHLELFRRALVVFGDVHTAEKHAVPHDKPNTQSDEQHEQAEALAFGIAMLAEYHDARHAYKDGRNPGDDCARQVAPSGGAVVLRIEILDIGMRLHERPMLHACGHGKRQANEHA